MLNSHIAVTRRATDMHKTPLKAREGLVYSIAELPGVEEIDKLPMLLLEA